MLELIKNGVLLRFILALAVTGVVLFLYATGQEVPQTLNGLMMLILGVVFGIEGNALVTRIKGR